MHKMMDDDGGRLDLSLGRAQELVGSRGGRAYLSRPVKHGRKSPWWARRHRDRIRRPNQASRPHQASR
jgi:hypothetical protein